MLRTTYLNLKKPEGSDPVNVQDFNDNADTIDTEVNARVKSSGGDIANTMVSAFTASTASYPVPAAGETPKVFMGKIKKFFEDFKSFKDSIVTKTMIINQILNDSTKAASAATVYSVNEKVDSAISDLIYKYDDAIALAKQDQVIRYGKDIKNIISVSLSIASPVTWTGNPFVIATLPVGFRPRKIEYMVCYANSGIALVQIQPDGRLITYTQINDSLCYGSVVFSG